MTADMVIVKSKADENWDAGVLCWQNAKYNAAINRFYYSLLQSVRYWLEKDYSIVFPDTCTTTHRDIVAELKNLSQAGGDATLKRHYRLFKDLRGERNKADYHLVNIVNSSYHNKLVADAMLSKNYFTT